LTNPYLLFGAFLISFVASCWVGDGDVIYDILHRKPSSKETVQRVRFVLLKAFTIFYGALLATIFVGHSVIEGMLLIKVWGNDVLIIFLPCWAVVALLVGILQNVIRQIQGRELRPLIDRVILRYVGRQWAQWFSRSKGQ
jgi:hypothetical protein